MYYFLTSCDIYGHLCRCYRFNICHITHESFPAPCGNLLCLDEQASGKHVSNEVFVLWTEHNKC